MCSGKSHLANQLAEAVGWGVVHTDDHLLQSDDEQLSYPGRVNYASLAAAVDALKEQPFLVEGICLRHVLAKLGVSCSVFIYVKRISPVGLWQDGFHLEDFEGNPNNEPHEAHRSDLRYHATERPHEQATFVFARVESSNCNES